MDTIDTSEDTAERRGRTLTFTGKYAQDRLMEDVLDDVIRRFEPVG